MIFAILTGNQLARAQELSEIGKQKPITLSGNLGIGLGTYNVSGIPARQRSFTHLFNGAPTLSIYGVALPFSVVVSDQQRSYTQPFNQYGMSPTYKWVTLHAGWRSIEFSPFTLAGHNFLGGGIELNPGKLRFGFVYGRFNKAIEADPNQPLALAQQPAYRRTGYSGKIGVGTERNHFDLIFLKAKDEANSLTLTPPSANLTPAENMVLGLSSRFSFFKHFVLEMDVSGSLYTRNMRSDTLENIDLKQAEFLKKLITLNTSTQLLSAGQASFGYQNPNYSLKVKYRRVDPDYKSMGAYYFESDVQNYTVEGMLRLFKSQFQLSGSFGVQNDNLLKDKAVRSNRKIGAINLAFNKPAYGFDLRYTNYGVTQDRGLNPIIDEFRIARTNHNLSSVLRYNINNERMNHAFILVGNLASLSDLNTFTAPQSESSSQTVNLSYQFGLPAKMFSVGINGNYTKAKIALGDNSFYGPTLNVNQGFKKGAINLGASASYQLQKLNGADAGNVINANLNGSYRITKKDAANLGLTYLKSNSTDLLLPSFNELRTNLGIVHSF